MKMNQPLFYGNLLVTLAFGAFAGLMFYRLANTKGKIKYAGRQWDATKITLIVITTKLNTIRKYNPILS